MAVVQALSDSGGKITLLLTGQQVTLVKEAIEDLVSPGSSQIVWLVESSDDATYDGWRHTSTSSLIKRLERFVPDAVAVVGDTDSARMGAATAFAVGIPVIHLEAGIRHHKGQPATREEQNRRAISRIADLHLCPSKHEADNLMAEGVRTESIVVVGDFSRLSLFTVTHKAADSMTKEELTSRLLARCPNLGSVLEKAYSIITLHRGESLSHKSELLRWLLTLASQLNDRCLIVVSRPDTRWESFCKDIETDSNVVVIPALPPRLFNHLIRNASCVITDSAGVQQESLLLGKSVWGLREEVELYQDHESLTIIPPPYALPENTLSIFKGTTSSKPVPAAWGRQAHAVARHIREALVVECKRGVPCELLD